MQTNRTADRPALAGSVRGLGLSDALRVELQPVQVPWLIDALDALCGAQPVDQGDGRDRDEREYELRLIRIMRAGLAVGADVSPVPFIGPSGMVATAVRSAMRSAMDALRELVRQDPIDDDGVERLQETADAVAAWVRSYVDCRAVVWFNVDPDAEPGANW